MQSSRKALIDITRLVDRTMQGRLPTGIDRVSLEYIRYFARQSTALIRWAGRWIELNPKHSQRMFQALLSPGPNIIPLVHRTVARALPFSFGRRFLEPRFLFNTGHNGLEKKEYVQRLQHSRLNPLFFIHDLIPLTHPEYCRPGEAKRHTLRMNTMLSMGQGIIANSLMTLNQLTAYAATLQLPLPPTVVAPLAPARLPTPSDRPPLDHPYFVILGTIEPRKNHWLLLQLWRQLIEQFGSTAPHLVIIGQRGWECENVVDLLERCRTLKGFVTEHSACTDDELANWLQHARALLFPSFTEGFGMPLLEALSLGVPVIASRLAVFHETAGDIPDYIDPLDGKCWRETIMAYAQLDSFQRHNQLQRIQHFNPPSWTTHFAQVENLMARFPLN